mgnify:CR=1 FL=1
MPIDLVLSPARTAHLPPSGSEAMISLERHHPDADAFQAACVYVARVLDRHARIRRVNAADVLVLETGASPDEDFEQRPFLLLTSLMI